MAAPHAGIQYPDLLREKRSGSFPKLIQRSFRSLALLRLIQIIRKFGLYCARRMSLQPEPAKRVFHQIPDDPIRREKLCGSRKSLRRDLDIPLKIGKNSLLWLRIVILIQPADDLHLLMPVLLGDLCHQPLSNAAGTQQICRKQQLRPAADFLKDLRQPLIQTIAQTDDQIPVKLLIRLFFQQFQHFSPVAELLRQAERLGEDLRPKGALAVGKYPDLNRKIAVDLHKTEGDEAVKPGVGGLLDDGLSTSQPYHLGQFFTLSIPRNTAVFADPQLIEPLSGSCHERLSCKDRIAPDRRSIQHLSSSQIGSRDLSADRRDAHRALAGLGKNVPSH